MDRVRLFSCGLMAIAGWGTTHLRPTLPTENVSLATFFASLLTQMRKVPAVITVVKKQPLTYTVTATAYEAIAGQTDAEPFVTADNSRIPTNYSSRTHWLALSRDLLRPWGGPFEFGDTVRVQGISPALDGVYVVHDTMARRHRRCLDVLVHPREHVDLFKAGAKLQLAAL